MVRITMEDGGIIDIELNEEVAPIPLLSQEFFSPSKPCASIIIYCILYSIKTIEDAVYTIAFKRAQGTYKKQAFTCE